MPTLNFVIKNHKNSGLIINSKELLSLFFYGVDIFNQQGTGIGATTFEAYIRKAQQEFEKKFSIKVVKQAIEERSDYYRDEFIGTGFIKTKYTVNTPYLLEGWLGENRQLSYPSDWLTSNKVNGRGITRQILVVPGSNSSAVAINNAFFTGQTFPYLGMVNTNSIGSYWKVGYITGFGCGEDFPYDLMEAIGKLASINVFNMLGDIILGAGIASQSISLDGLSQSISSTASATSAGFGARIITYQKEIAEYTKSMQTLYKGLTLTSI